MYMDALDFTQYCVHIWRPDRIYITLILQGIRQINNTRIIHLKVPNR